MRDGRVLPAALSIALVALTLSPLLRDPIEDDFPLSTYPMFALDRPRLFTMSYALGVTRTGERRYLSPELVGTREVLQARAIIEHAVQGGWRELGPLCIRIAERAAARFPDVVAIRIVTGTHDAVDLLVRDQIGIEVEQTRCAVLR